LSMADNPEVKVESAKASPEQETRPKPKKRRRLKVAHPERCIGCLGCMFACSRVHTGNVSLQDSAIKIQTQGGMPVSEGLALWLTYMRRVEAFVDASGARAVHLPYAQLLDDWRGSVQSIARCLDAPLAIEPCADEVDRFLEADMRKHQATDTELDAHLGGEPGEAIRAMYRRLLERCEQRVAAPPAAQPPRPPETGFR